LVDLKIVGYYTNNGVEEDEVESPRTVDREVETLGFLIDNRSTFTFSPSTSLTLTYGGEYYQDEQTGADNETMDGTRGGVPDATTDFYGLFLQADLSLTDLGGLPGELHIIPAVRWDGFKSSAAGEVFNIDEDAVSPKIGVSYKPVPEFLIFANYAEGFRAPSFNEAFADGVHFNIPNLTAPPGPFGPSFVSNLFIGNPNLTPENSQTWEVGAGVDFADIFSDSDTFTLKASYYNSNVDDLIGLDVNTPLGCFVPMFAMIQPCGTGAPFNTSQNVNIANAKITGFELEFSYNSEFFYARGNASTINGRDVDTDEFLEGTLQPNIIFVDAGVKYAPWGLRTGIRFTHAGTFDEVNTAIEERGSYTLADLYAVWTPQIEALDGIRVDAGIDNIGDTAYEVVNAGVFEAGRNFKIAVSYNFGF
jgi:hemoglobin/transferrin/lactoferrin receptor protein